MSSAGRGARVASSVSQAWPTGSWLVVARVVARRSMPVLILTARDGFQERIEGIDTGADDYLTKPFRMDELLARLRAVLRRTTGRRSPILSAGGLDIDTLTQTVSVVGRAVAVSALEYRVLAYLLHHKGRTVPRRELVEHVYGDANEHDPNVMDALVSRLRRKLAIDLIETRRGHGYLVESGD